MTHQRRDARTLRVPFSCPLIGQKGFGQPFVLVDRVQEWAEGCGLRPVEIEIAYEDDGVMIRAYRDIVFANTQDAILFKMTWL